MRGVSNKVFYARRVVFAAFLLFSVFAQGELSARGRGDPTLEEADELIKEKQYSRAIKLLTGFIDNDMDNFDKAQTRIHEIIAEQNRYNAYVNKLLDIIQENPEEAENIYVMAEEVLAMKTIRSEQTKEYVERIQEIAYFEINRRALERILKEGRSLLDKEEYLAAFEKYQSGFSLYQNDMRQANFPRQVYEGVDRSLAAKDRGLTQAELTINPLAGIRASILRVNKRSSPEQQSAVLNEAFVSLIPQLDRLIEAKSQLAAAEKFFQDEAASREMRESRLRGRNFFSFAEVLIRGRNNEGKREGLVGVVEALWLSVVAPLEDAYIASSERLYGEALKSTEANQSRAPADIAQAKNFIKNPGTLAEKSETFLKVGAEVAAAGNIRVNSSIEDDILKSRAMGNALDYFSDVVSLRASFNTLKRERAAANVAAAFQRGQLSAAAAYSRAHGFSASFLEFERKLQSDLDSANGQIASLSARASQNTGAIQDSLRYLGDAKRVLEALKNSCLEEGTAAAAESFTYANMNFKNKVASSRQRFEDARKLAGTSTITTEDGLEVEARYPREASLAFSALDADIARDIAEGNGVLAEFKALPREIAANAQIAKQSEESAVSVGELAALQREERLERAQADERFKRAEAFRSTGERLIAESRAALGKDDFERARSLLEEGAASYLDSLALQESAALRRRWGSDIEPLSEEIARAEYEAVVLEVRDLINASRERYYNGNFESAESSLTRAESRWARVSTEPNEEVEYWLALVRAGRSLRSSSDIPITAPLYPEMSQLLDDAQKKYFAALTLFKENRRDEGVRMFNEAREKTQEVRLIYPTNQEAGILEMRIDKEINPASFEQTFRTRFASAVAGAKRGSMESYIELENLSEINPSFSGMKAALTEARYDVGLERRPVVAGGGGAERSMDLARRAQAMLASSAASQYRTILNMANEALQLNPNNTLAAQVKDRVQLAMSRPAVVSDQATEQEYLRAVREFQQGNKILAMSIVQRLLQNPANKNNVRLNALRDRIAATM